MQQRRTPKRRSVAPEPAAPPPARRTRLAIIATKGTLDWAYPPLMLALQAARKGRPRMGSPDFLEFAKDAAVTLFV